MKNMKIMSICLCLGMLLWACAPSADSPDTEPENPTETPGKPTVQPFEDNSLPLATINDTSTQTIMERLFGSFSESGKESLLEAGFVKETDLLEKANMDTDSDLKAKMEYKTALGDGRVLFVVSASAEGNDCHACAPIIGAGLLYPNNKQWDIKGFKFFDAAGIYGIAPDMEVEQISPNDYALVQATGDMHMGLMFEAVSLHSVNNGFAEILSLPIYEDNSGACNTDNEMPDLPPCYEHKTSLKFVPSSSGYYEIHTHRTGDYWDMMNEKLEDMEEKKVLTYQGGKYK